MIDYLMQQLCNELNIAPALKPKSPGIYVIEFETKNVKIEALPLQGLQLSTNLGQFPSHRDEEFFEGMLSANLFGERTLGSVLGLSQDATTITLTHTVERRLDYREFRDIVEDFLNIADAWQEEAQVLT